MARTLKEPEVRRREIIEASKKLFEKKGYENTSVENIINAANIAKGTFYYYFKTKKDVLDAVVKNIAETMYDLLEKISNSADLSTMNKLTHIFAGTDKKLIANSDIMQVIHEPENRELQEKLNIYYVEKIIPLITEVFNQGYFEKLWRRKISVQTVQIILGGTQFILDSGLFNWSIKQRKIFFSEIEQLLESSTGATSGTFEAIFNKL